MRRKLWLAIGSALVVLSVGAIGCTGGFTFPESQPVVPESTSIILSQQNTGIWVTGEGKVSVVPDVAVLSLGIEAQATSVAEKDIKTQYFSIQPVKRWENNREILLGYRVSNMVTVKIRQVDDTGAIIDAVAKAGGDYTRINSISFVVDDPSAYHEEAREKAMADAKAKAKQLADLAGVDLGKPIYISESGGFIPIPREYYAMAEGAPALAPTTPISPGETEVRLTVQVAYNIKS